jgi:hypothetical protein
VTSSPTFARELLVAASIALTCLALAPAARAQDLLAADEAERHTDLARGLFGEGVALVAERRFAEAEAKFREALALHDAPSIRANLASALYEQGEYPEAFTLATGVAGDETAPEASRESVRLLLEQIRAQAGYVHVEGLPEGGQVAIDELVIPEPASETPVAPGAHVATLTQEDVERARRPFEVATGDHLALTFEIEPPAPVEEPVLPSPPPEPPLVEQPWFWGTIGGAVVLVAVAVGVGIAVGTSGGMEPALEGDFEPGVLRW